MLDVQDDGGLRTLDPPASAAMFVGQSDGLSVGQHVAAAMLDVDCKWVCSFLTAHQHKKAI